MRLLQRLSEIGVLCNNVLAQVGAPTCVIANATAGAGRQYRS